MCACRSVLFGQWGFGSTEQQGLTCLFHGAPGTGKSLAAEAIGYEVGKPLKVATYELFLRPPYMLWNLCDSDYFFDISSRWSIAGNCLANGWARAARTLMPYSKRLVVLMLSWCLMKQKDCLDKEQT